MRRDAPKMQLLAKVSVSLELEPSSSINKVIYRELFTLELDNAKIVYSSLQQLKVAMYIITQRRFRDINNMLSKGTNITFMADVEAFRELYNSKCDVINFNTVGYML